MTEAEWLASTDPVPMLRWVGGEASARKLRLYGCAWGDSLGDRLTDERSRQAIRTAERFADGRADATELLLACTAAQQAWNEIPEVLGERRVRGNRTLNARRAARRAAAVARDAASPRYTLLTALCHTWGQNAAGRFTLANHLRDLFGNPFRPAAVDPAWLSWQDGAVRRVAETIYEDRCYQRLPVLGDALEDAGCTNADVLGHCREPGRHVRGCWLLDLILSKDR
jgi:hypothetical protein